jgi:hypothetical protein
VSELDLKHASRLARNAAIKAGKDTFPAVKPCIRGHLTERYVHNRRCVQCQANVDADLARIRQWRIDHPAEVKPPATRYYDAPCKFGHTEGRWLRTDVCVVCFRLTIQRTRRSEHIPNCEPPAGTRNLTWHTLHGILVKDSEPVDFPALWTDQTWKAVGVAHRTPSRAASYGWTYVKPL